jgi:hypothetical protein
MSLCFACVGIIPRFVAYVFPRFSAKVFPRPVTKSYEVERCMHARHDLNDELFLHTLARPQRSTLTVYTLMPITLSDLLMSLMAILMLMTFSF